MVPMSKVLPSVLILLLVLAACGRRTTTLPDSGSPAGLEASAQEPLPGQETDGQEDSQPELEAPPAITMSPAQNATPRPLSPSLSLPESPVATEMPASVAPASVAPAPRTPAPRTPGVKIPVVQPSRSLAGHDRFLVSRPFGGVGPADFELGLLFEEKADLPFRPLLNGLARALTAKTLKAAAFSSQALILAELLYNPDLVLAPVVTRVRFSEARRMPGTTYALGIRLFSDTGFAEGLAILGTDEEDNWQIEHLDLDLKGPWKPTSRAEPWDPYGYSRNLFD